MQQQDTTPAHICQLFPPLQRQALVRAAARGDMSEIDAITDELVRLGLCRPREQAVMLSRWQVAAQMAGMRGL